MERPLPPKRAATIGCDNDHESVCDGIRVDDER